VSSVGNSNPQSGGGFSLLESALVLLILGVATLVLAGSFDNTAAGTERDAARSHGQIMQNALRSFALAHGRLPCPDTVAIDTGTSGWETFSAGACATPTGTGMLPYKSLGLDIPDRRLRAAYGVYLESTSTLNVANLISKLNTAGTITPPTNTILYLTGDNQTLGSVNCTDNVRINPAFVLVVPLRDRDQAGNEFDGIHNAFATGSSRCASAPGTPMTAQVDDVVVAESFATLGAWLQKYSP
jgi:type II secretory pathway pseudopilin PulG